ncbi:MAG: metallophosphoesterase [Candidatus Azobacteroides sp.]|nr:metallophosphoesterase [Candidatus Azobacteroides sp.]
MRKIFILLLIPLCNMISATPPLKIGVFSDPHFLSPELMDGGKALQDYQHSIGRNIEKLPEILDATLDELINQQIDVLLIPGDLTLNGERQSHLDLREKLLPLLTRGIKVCVVPGNHDIHIPSPVGFRGNERYAVESITPEEFERIYAESGYNTALYKDTYSLSYVTDIGDNIWLLGIDACLYKEYQESSITAGRISTETEAWITGILQQATENNKKVIGMMHHGLVEHIMYQSRIFPQYLVDDWQRLAEKFADLGMKFIFTGHFHSHDITAYETKAGNTIYDIETSSLQSYPFPYRIIEIEGEVMNIWTHHINVIPSEPELLSNGKENLQQWLERFIRRTLSSKYPVPEEMLNEITEIGTEIVVLHIEGDEKISDELLERIKSMFRKIDIPVDINAETLQLDFPPADNNVSLPF